MIVVLRNFLQAEDANQNWFIALSTIAEKERICLPITMPQICFFLVNGKRENASEQWNCCRRKRNWWIFFHYTLCCLSVSLRHRKRNCRFTPLRHAYTDIALHAFLFKTTIWMEMTLRSLHYRPPSFNAGLRIKRTKRWEDFPTMWSFIEGGILRERKVNDQLRCQLIGSLSGWGRPII